MIAEQYAVVIGKEIFDGSNFVGPFEDFEDADEWGDKNSDGQYWVIRLDKP